jgi:chromosome segregation ATPase
MEPEQLIGVVRSMRAQKIALDYMDEILTAVLAAKDTTATLNTQAADLTVQIADAQQRLQTLNASVPVRQAAIAALLATAEQASSDRLAQLSEQERLAQATHVTLLQTLDRQLQDKTMAQQAALAILESNRQAAEAACTDANARLSAVKQALAELSQRIQPT